MKAVSLEIREKSKKNKDAYDIIYCLRNYPGGSAVLSGEFRTLLPNHLIEHGLNLLSELFESIESMGPKAYAERSQPDDYENYRREALERVKELLDAIHPS